MCCPGWFFKILKTEEWKAKQLGGDALVEPVRRVFWYHCLFEEVVRRNHGNVRENNLFYVHVLKALPYLNVLAMSDLVVGHVFLSTRRWTSIGGQQNTISILNMYVLYTI